MSNQEKLNQKLLKQRKKYHIFKLFGIKKKKVMNLYPLPEILSNYSEIYLHKEIPREKERSWHPFNLCDTKQDFTPIQLEPIRIWRLKNKAFTIDHYFFLDLDKEKLYLDTYFQNLIKKGEVDYSNNSTIYYHTDIFAKIRYLPIKNLAFSEVLFMGGLFTTNYYHFIIELLARFQYIPADLVKRKVPIVLNSHLQKIPNLMQLINVFLPKEMPVYFIEPNIFWKTDKIWYVSQVNFTIPNVHLNTEYYPWYTHLSTKSLDWIREKILTHIPPAQLEVPARIYLARRSTARKYNEPELIEVAQKFGFEPIYLEDYDIASQITILQKAQYVIGPSGAAWTNLLFTKPGKTKGLIFMSEIWKNFAPFATLARQSGVDIRYLRFPATSSEFHHNFAIPPQDFSKALTDFLTQ